MQKNSVKGAEADKAKRSYRSALECIKRLDELQSGPKAYRDAFLPETIGLRYRLKDYCERMMFAEPTEYGRRAEELLWRKVFYNIIQLAKTYRKHMRGNKGVECAVRTHLLAAAGYYNHLLLRLQYEYDLALEGRQVDFFYVPEAKSSKKPHQLKRRYFEPEVLEWARKACHRCLVCLGDVARYQSEFDGLKSRTLARRYYRQALYMIPELGMPFNQLGTLVGPAHYNCSAAYYYMRCLLCEVQFNGAQKNLKRLFEKNRKRYADMTLDSPRNIPPDQQKFKDIKRFLVRFMNLIDVFHYNVQRIDNQKLQDMCQNTLQDFNLCMYYQPQQSHQRLNHELSHNDEKVSYLDDDLVFKILVMSIMTMYNLQNARSKALSAARAFSLALFSHVLNHAISRLQSAIDDFKSQNKKINGFNMNVSSLLSDDSTDSEPGKTRNFKNNNNNGNDEKKIKQKKKLITRDKRRRRKDSESDLSIGSDEDDEDDDGDDGDDDLQNDRNTDDSESDKESIHYLTSSDSDSDKSDDDPLSEGQGQEGQQTNSVKVILRKGSNISELFDEKKEKDTKTSSDFGFISNGDAANPFGMSSYNGPEPTLTPCLSIDILGSTLIPNLPLPDEDNSLCQDVVEGKKQVSLPPGFDHDPEAMYVDEITRKMATFNIETDTETGSHLQTDASENNSMAGSDRPDPADFNDLNSDHGSDHLDTDSDVLRAVVDIFTNEGLMPTIKIFLDWMMCHRGVLEACAESSHMLWSRLSILLNILPRPHKFVNLDLCESMSLITLLESCSNEDWNQTHPLAEDLHVRRLPPLKHVHSKISNPYLGRMSLSETQETLLRVSCILKFGHSITAVDQLPLNYSHDTNMFFGPLPVQEDRTEKVAQQEKMVDTEARRNQLMRDMAQLRLQAEVKQLEGSLKHVQLPSLPPYVIVDTSALNENLAEVKKMLTSQRFIIIVPLAVIDELDIMKADRDSRMARESIRFLEFKFKKGNRYIRAQKMNERLAATPSKSLKRRDRDKWYRLRVLDCCRYFARQRAGGHKVCFVTHLISNKLKEILKSQQYDGINAVTVTEFMRKLVEYNSSGTNTSHRTVGANAALATRQQSGENG